ncbi:hypothetical protein M0811_12874 [Anaeramoeba ignava]|uniref:Uncharacterized protein n=1 Tax=Anaeramoeba ignava TaxID=1746090 RepID=A0A9Q0L701_ANAIG|nr:hypothetical protein M0811_12874 [Anaeramoeba ignava]
MNFFSFDQQNNPVTKIFPEFEGFLTPEKDQFHTLLYNFYSTSAAKVVIDRKIKEIKETSERQESTLWRMESRSQTQSKYCHGNHLTASVTYTVAIYDSDVAMKLNQTYSQLIRSCHTELCEITTKVETTEAKVALYLQRVFQGIPFKSLRNDENMNLQFIQQLRSLLINLFFFERLAIETGEVYYDKFNNSLHKWINTVALRLYEIGSNNQMLFVFFHLLTTPHSGKWSKNLIYLQDNFDYDQMSYLKTLLKFVVNPLIKSKTLSDKPFYLLEPDFVHHLSNLPFSNFFGYLFANPGELGFSVASEIVQEFVMILIEALVRFEKYLDFRKTIADLMFHFFWLYDEFSHHINTPDAARDYPKIIDELTTISIGRVSACQDKSILFYFTDLPFYSLSVFAGFRIMSLFFTGSDQNPPQNPEQWYQLMNSDPSLVSRFGSLLQSSNGGESMLIILANLAVLLNSPDFALCVVDLIFRVSCVVDTTKDRIFPHGKKPLQQSPQNIPFWFQIFSLSLPNILVLSVLAVWIYLVLFLSPNGN